MKKLLLIVLLLSQPIYAHGNDYLFRQEAVEREIAEFEAELAAQQLADNLAAYQAKIDAERALAAKNLAAFEARKAAEFEAELVSFRCL